MITNGFVVTEKLSGEAINEITETAQLLSIEIGELNHDKTVPSSVKITNKVDTHSKPNKLGKKFIGESSLWCGHQDRRPAKNPELRSCGPLF